MTNLRRSLAVILDWMRGDLGMAGRHALRSTLAGSWYMPRVGRFLLYRLAGINTQSANIFPGVTFMGPGHNLTIGPGAGINTGCFFDLEGPVTIGLDAMFGNNVTVLTSHHETIDGVVQREPQPRAVTIGDRVWLGAGVTIVPGVTIGDHVIVAAGSVVSRDLEPDGIYGGIPARRLKDL